MLFIDAYPVATQLVLMNPLSKDQTFEELEFVARHLTTLSTEAASGSREATRLRDRVGALEAARQELADLDLATGLYSRA